MYHYIYLLEDVSPLGIAHPDRTGVGCRKIFGDHIIYREGEFPFELQRPMGIRNAWEEMKFFLSGETDTKTLEEKGINFWRGNTSRQFLDSWGLHQLPEGNLGAAYSKQFRNAFGTQGIQYGRGYEPIDQVQNLIYTLRFDPFSRRMAIDLWGLSEQWAMPILPCWFRSAWSVEQRGDSLYLHMAMYSRSLDVLFGYRQAVMQYRLFQMALAKMMNFEVGEQHVFLWDVHVYQDQVEYVAELLAREPGKPGKVTLTKEVHSLDDILALEHTDFEIVGYEPNREPMKTPRPPMAV